jgi:hypothetical protein
MKTRRNASMAVRLVGGGVAAFLLLTSPGFAQSTVIGHVGKDDITLDDLTLELKSLSVTPDKATDDTKRRALNAIAKRKYLSSRAVASGIDQEPATKVELSRLRDQLLANASLQRRIQAQASLIKPPELDRYIEANPRKFANRKKLITDQVTIQLGPETQSILDAVREKNSLDEVAAKLSEKGVPFSRGVGTLTTDQGSDAFLATVEDKRGPNDVLFVPIGSAGIFFKVRSEEPAPLSGDEARKRASQLMVEEIVQSEMAKPLGPEAEVKYEGDYARLMSQAPGK